MILAVVFGIKYYIQHYIQVEKNTNSRLEKLENSAKIDKGRIYISSATRVSVS